MGAEPAAASAPGADKGAAGPDVEELFQNGKRLIEANKIEDGWSPSFEDLDRGIVSLEEALRRGHPDRKEGLKVLVDGYSAIAMDGKRGQAAATRLRELYSQLMNINPEDPTWAVELSEIARTPEEKRSVLKKGIERNPRDFGLRQVYGAFLCGEGEKKAGAAQFVEAARVMKPDEARQYGGVLIDFAAQCRDQESYALVWDLVNKKRAEAKPGKESQGAEGGDEVGGE